jgi:hypothetical protein
MTSAPVITGKVLDPQGDPLAAALVRAYHRQYTPYGTKLKIVKKGMTNDFGEFRLYGVNFGEYFVSAGYGDRDRSAAIGKTQLSENVSKADDGFATVFYDGAEDISRAQAARLAPGSETAPLNIYLRDPARFKIRGQVLPPTPGTKIALAPKGSDLTDADYFIEPNAGGSFEIRGVSPGSYLLVAMTEDNLNESEVVSINVTDSDIDGVRLALATTVSVSGAVVWEGSPRAGLAGMHVRLVRSAPEFDQTINTGLVADGTFTFEHVSPFAEYDIDVGPLPAGVYVKSISGGGRDFLRGISRLVPFSLLQIVLASAADGLDVQVTRGNEPAAGAQVVLIPGFPFRRRPDRYVTGYTDELGNLHLTAVPPGTYTAYAFEQTEPNAYYALGYSALAVQRFGTRSIPVTMDSGAKAIQLKVIPAEETAGGFQ